MELTKKELNKMMVAERAAMRQKHKQSEFMKRTLSIYNGQKSRAEEKGVELPFTLDDFRAWLKFPFENRNCRCGQKLTVKNMAIDHKVPIARGGGWGLDNQQVLCKPCNFRKGQLLPDEFNALNTWVVTNLSPDSREDLWRRLTLGGKWSFAGK
jgi:hypothetical protein